MSSEGDPKPALCEYEVEIKGNITTVKIPETYFSESPTQEQKELLTLLEKEFACRYTDEDEDYVATIKLGSTTPPIVSSYNPFWNRRRDDRPRNGKRTWENRRSHSHNRYSDNSSERNNYGQYYNDYRR